MRATVIFTSFISLLLPLTAFAESLASEQAMAVKVQEAILQRHYDQAELLAQNVASSQLSPFPTVVKMAVMQSRMFENFTFTSENEFSSISAKNEALCDSLLASDTTDTWDLMLCGASDAMRSFFHLKNHQTFKALSVANRALDTLKKVKEKDPENIDVELGFALYDFFKSEFTETKLSFLPFFKDKRDGALTAIYQVSASGTYARNLADFCLAFIALETERKDLAAKLYPRMLEKFPDSVLFRIMYAAFAIKVKDFSRAMAILESLQKMAPEITAAKYFMGRALALEGKKLAEAKVCLTEYLTTNPDVSVKGPSYYLLGLVAEKEGQLGEAMKYYKLGYDTYPRYKPSLKHLLRLKNRKA